MNTNTLCKGFTMGFKNHTKRDDVMRDEDSKRIKEDKQVERTKDAKAHLDLTLENALVDLEQYLYVSSDEAGVSDSLSESLIIVGNSAVTALQECTGACDAQMA